MSSAPSPSNSPPPPSEVTPINTSSASVTRSAPPHILPSKIVTAPSGFKLHLVTSLQTNNWPSELILDLGKANWAEWSRKLSSLALGHGLDVILNGRFPCPDDSAANDARYIWERNDGCLRGFIQDHISAPDLHAIEDLATSHLMFKRLRSLHEQQGAYAQLQLLLKALNVHFTHDKPLQETLAELRSYGKRIVAMGQLSDDDIFSIIYLNALEKDFGPLQHSITSLSNSPNFNSSMMAQRILAEDALILRRTEAGRSSSVFPLPLSSSTAFPASVTSRPRSPRPVCANCKRDTHGTDYCIAPGGKMAGRTIEEARAARAASRENKQPRGPTSAHVASSSVAPPTSTPVLDASRVAPQDTFFLNGKLYGPIEPSWTSSSTSDSAHVADFSDPEGTLFPYHAFVALSSPSLSTSSVFSAVSTPSSALPFIIDTGASCHISPLLSDFDSIRPIRPHPITGLGNHSVAATGIGTIKLRTSLGLLVLNNALYVPTSSVRLISVFLLGEARFNAHFYPHEGHCFISDANNTIVARGTALPNRKLFVLSNFSVPVHFHTSFPSSAHYVSRLPDVDSWHKRLGHCGPRAVLDMARSKVVEGMPIDTSSEPAKCPHCILGKQTRSSVPRVREGVKATCQLERVYVDLCGPMSVSSRSGRLYSMNIIDDYSGFVWSLPLRSKAEAAVILQHWLTFLEVQTPYRLKSFVTDNGELASLAIHDWCTRKGIQHLFTAPYTSAHNGRAERLHRTLLDKARAMKSACNAPTDMWDEFCATSAYLTNLTGASANKGKTPYELWYNKKPSLSHLREIGCHAFALIPTHNPKINHRSLPCILIGYAPNSKAYRLWDTTSNRIFNSYHVSFIESRQLPHSNYSPAPAPTNNSSSRSQQSQPVLSSPPRSSDPPLLQPPPVILSSPPPPPPAFSPSQHLSQHQDSNTPQAVVTPQAIVTPQPVIIQQPTISPQMSVSPQDHVSPQNPNSHQDLVSPQVSIPPQEPISPEEPIPPQEQEPVPCQEQVPVSPQNPISLQEPISPQNTTTNNPLISITPPSPPLPPSPSPLPAPPPLRRSPRIQTIPKVSYRDTTLLAAAPSPLIGSDQDPRVSAFLAEYAPLRDTHYLLPLTLDASSATLSVNEVLTALVTGNTETAISDDDDPLWSAAINGTEKEYWIAGVREELKSLQDLNVFVLVPRSSVPKDQRPLKGKLVCKRKRDDAGNIARYKVRYVAKGFAQRYRIDYNKTTAPTARLESFRCLLHIAACLDWDIQHVDIKTAFLHGVLPSSETVFMEQPPGFEEPGKEDWVWRLVKSIYGMRQASRIWNKTFHKSITALGFQRLVSEWCVYRRHSATGITMFAVHVDDIICISDTIEENNRFKSELRQHWELSDLGPVKYALGIAITRDRSSRTISLSQTALIDRIVEEFGQLDAHPVDTPMVAGLQIVRPDKTLPISETDAAWIQRTPYRSLIGTLNYLAVASRPDIAFAVGRLATVLDCYRTDHWDAAIRVVRYLKGTRLFRLELGGYNAIHPIGFSDSDWANCPSTSRSIGGYCFSLGSGMISWASHKQSLASDSSCYAEYIALHDASNEVVFLRQLLEGLQMLRVQPSPIYCDSESARRLTEDQRWHSKVRHFRVKYHSTRELVDWDEVNIIGIRSTDNTADLLTKSLTRPHFEHLRGYMGILPPRSP